MGGGTNMWVAVYVILMKKNYTLFIFSSHKGIIIFFFNTIFCLAYVCQYIVPWAQAPGIFPNRLLQETALRTIICFPNCLQNGSQPWRSGLQGAPPTCTVLRSCNERPAQSMDFLWIRAVITLPCEGRQAVPIRNKEAQRSTSAASY